MDKVRLGGVDAGLLELDTSVVPWRVRPRNPLAVPERAYFFKLILEDWNGNIKSYPSDTIDYELHLGCPHNVLADIVTNVANAALSLTSTYGSASGSQVFYVETDLATDFYTFSHGYVTSITGSTFCGISSVISNIQYNIVQDYSSNDIMSDPTQPIISWAAASTNPTCDANTDCAKFDLSTNMQEFYMEFTFDISVVGYIDGLLKATRTIGPVPVNFTCWGHPSMGFTAPQMLYPADEIIPNHFNLV